MRGQDDTFSAGQITTNNADGSFNEAREENILNEAMPFETKAIFTLADFLKQLHANEYYDIAQRFYSDWLDDRLGTKDKLQQLFDTLSRTINNRKIAAFYQLKSNARITFLEQENMWLRERLDAAI